jgi:hypothetical protein
MDNIFKSISKIYHDPLVGYVSSTNLKRKLQEQSINATTKQVNEFLANEESYQLNKHIHKPKSNQYNSIHASANSESYQMDLMIYDRWEYHNYKYILCIIDVHSRYASCRALTNRKLDNLMENIKDVFKEMGIPKNINCDNEFNKNEFNKYAEEHNIKMYYSQPEDINKNAIVERFNRTLANKIQLWRTSTGKYDWHSVLNDLVKNYNNTEHSTLKCKPADIWSGKGQSHQKLHFVKNNYEVDDHVRIRISKTLFSKGDQQKFSKSVYKITKIDGNKIYVSDQDRYFKPYELIKVNLNTIHRKEEDEDIVKDDDNKEIVAEDLPYDYDEIVDDRKARRVNKAVKKVLKIEMNNIVPLDEKRIRKPNPKYNF